MRELLRHVGIGDTGYELKLYDTGEVMGKGYFAKSRLAYEFGKPGEPPIFEGDDFGCSPCYPTDSNEALRSLMGFLTLRPGDTDDEYFENYTPEQLAFAENDAGDLSLWCDDEEPEPFVYLDGWED